MKIEEMRRLLIVGAGTMGQQIGLQCAMHGYQVVLYDIEDRALGAAQRHIENFADQLVGAGRPVSCANMEGNSVEAFVVKMVRGGQSRLN